MWVPDCTYDCIKMNFGKGGNICMVIVCVVTLVRLLLLILFGKRGIFHPFPLPWVFILIQNKLHIFNIFLIISKVRYKGLVRRKSVPLKLKPTAP